MKSARVIVTGQNYSDVQNRMHKIRHELIPTIKTRINALVSVKVALDRLNQAYGYENDKSLLFRDIENQFHNDYLTRRVKLDEMLKTLTDEANWHESEIIAYQNRQSEMDMK